MVFHLPMTTTYFVMAAIVEVIPWIRHWMYVELHGWSVSVHPTEKQPRANQGRYVVSVQNLMHLVNKDPQFGEHWSSYALVFIHQSPGKTIMPSSLYRLYN